MLRNRYVWGGLIVIALVLANIINYFASGWGLITVKVKDVALSKVIKSVERQGGVTIYTNADLSAPITMNVYRVPLAEAMQTLSENIPPPDAAPDGAPAGGGGGGRRGGFGGAQWRLAFFAAPSSAQVKQEISAFQSGGGADDDHKVFTYPTPIQMLASDSFMPVSDPRLQVWPGLKPAPTPAPAPTGNDGTAASSDPSADAPEPPSTVQDYLNILAESADIWIMAPSSWDAKVSSAPGANSSIADAVKTVVSRAHGSVEQALILSVRTPGQRAGRGAGRGFVGGDNGWSYLQDRLNNAINGLPPDARADAAAHLADEANFRKSVAAAPADQRGQLWRGHMMEHMGNMDNWRKSPEARAKMYSHLVSNREAVKGQ